MDIALALLLVIVSVIGAIVFFVWEKSGDFLRRRKVARASLRELARMASGKDWKLRLEVAKCRNTPAVLLDKLAKDADFVVAEAVASRPDISYEAIVLLWKGRQERALLRNEGIRADRLLELCSHEDSEVRGFSARHANLPPSGIEALARDSDAVVRGLVAERNDLTDHFYGVLAADEDEDVRLAVAENSCTPENVLLKLIDDRSLYVRHALVERPVIPEALLLRLARDKDLDIRLVLAAREDLPAEVQRLLANDENEEVRAELAGNSHVSTSLLRGLADDRSALVRAVLCENDSTPPEALAVLAASTDEEVLDALASRANAEAMKRDGGTRASTNADESVGAAGRSGSHWLFRYKKTLVATAAFGAIVIAIETRDRSEENLPENAQSILSLAGRILAAQERIQTDLGCPFRKTAALLSADVARSEGSAFCGNAGFSWKGPYVDGGEVSKEGSIQIRLAAGPVTFGASANHDPQGQRWKTSLVVDGMPAPLLREVSLTCNTFHRKLLCISFPEDEARGRLNILSVD